MHRNAYVSFVGFPPLTCIGNISNEDFDDRCILSHHVGQAIVIFEMAEFIYPCCRCRFSTNQSGRSGMNTFLFL